MPAAPTVRPPRKGPMFRQRRPAKYLGSKFCAHSVQANSRRTVRLMFPSSYRHEMRRIMIERMRTLFVVLVFSIGLWPAGRTTTTVLIVRGDRRSPGNFVLAGSVDEDWRL